MAVDYKTVLTDVRSEVHEREVASAQVWAEQKTKARVHPAWRAARLVLLVAVLAGLAVVWTPIVREQVGARAVTAADGNRVEDPALAAVVGRLWEVRRAFDQWRFAHQGEVPERLAVLPEGLRTCPVTKQPWRYEVGGEGGYRLACPDPSSLGVEAVFLDGLRGPPQVRPR